MPPQSKTSGDSPHIILKPHQVTTFNLIVDVFEAQRVPQTHYHPILAGNVDGGGDAMEHSNSTPYYYCSIILLRATLKINPTR